MNLKKMTTSNCHYNHMHYIAKTYFLIIYRHTHMSCYVYMTFGSYERLSLISVSATLYMEIYLLSDIHVCMSAII